MKRFIVSILLVSFTFLSLHSQVLLSDSAKISLMTASPWPNAVYALFGHTAILVQDDSTHTDSMFNYGFFDTSEPNFIYHFMRGETDYVLGVTSYEDFLFEYKFKGVEVVQQELNLTQIEKQALWEALYINSLPENRQYRYNYFYDNCATRPRDMIEKYINGKVIYPPTAKPQSYRDLVDECVNNYPWIKFGISLLLGPESDRIIDVREKMFVPNYLKNSFENAVIQKNDTLQYPLVKNQQIVLEENLNPTKPGIFKTHLTPLVVALIMIFLTLIVSVININYKKNVRFPKLYDTLIFSITGIAGFIIFFLMFFSVHPATNPNWNFIWLNIFALIVVPLFWVKSMKKVVYVYHFINFAVLTLFLVIWYFIPQQLPLATIPFSLCLWIRSAVNVWIYRKEKRTNTLVSRKY